MLFFSRTEEGRILSQCITSTALPLRQNRRVSSLSVKLICIPCTSFPSFLYLSLYSSPALPQLFQVLFLFSLSFSSSFSFPLSPQTFILSSTLAFSLFLPFILLSRFSFCPTPLFLPSLLYSLFHYPILSHVIRNFWWDRLMNKRNIC